MPHDRPKLIYDLLDAVHGAGELWRVESDLDALGLSDEARPLLRRVAWGMDEERGLPTRTQLYALVARIGQVIGRDLVESTPASDRQALVIHCIHSLHQGESPMARASDALANMELVEAIGLFDRDDPEAEHIAAMRELATRASQGFIEGCYDHGFLAGITTRLVQDVGTELMTEVRKTIEEHIPAHENDALSRVEARLAWCRDELARVACDPEAEAEQVVGIATVVAATDAYANDLARRDLCRRFLVARENGVDPLDAIEDARDSCTGELLLFVHRAENPRLDEDTRGEACARLEAIGRVQGVLLTDDEVSCLEPPHRRPNRQH